MLQLSKTVDRTSVIYMMCFDAADGLMECRDKVSCACMLYLSLLGHDFIMVLYYLRLRSLKVREVFKFLMPGKSLKRNSI